MCGPLKSTTTETKLPEVALTMNVTTVFVRTMVLEGVTVSPVIGAKTVEDRVIRVISFIQRLFISVLVTILNIVFTFI